MSNFGVSDLFTTSVKKMFLWHLLNCRDYGNSWMWTDALLKLKTGGLQSLIDANAPALKSLIEDGLVVEGHGHVRLSEKGLRSLVMQELEE